MRDMVEAKHLESQQIAADIERFLAAGGEIQTARPGVSGIGKIDKNVVFMLRETSGLTQDWKR